MKAARYYLQMTGWEFALWGAAGSFAVEGLEMTAAVKKINAWPWGHPDYPSVKASLAALAIRMAIGALVATAAGLGGQVTGVLGGFAAGIAAPLLIEKLGMALPSSAPTPAPVQLPGVPNSTGDGEVK
jgi:hypothetical protein